MSVLYFTLYWRSSQGNKARLRKKRNMDQKLEKTKLFLFIDDFIIYVENSKDFLISYGN